MAKVTLYSPNNILLPKTLCQRHAKALSPAYDFLNYIGMKEKFSKVLPNACYPLIHDVFRSRDNKRLIALDSAWHKLEQYKKQWLPLIQELLPLKILCNGQTLKYQYHTLPWPKHYQPRLGIFEMKLPAKLRSMPVIVLDFEWKNVTQSISVPVNPFAMLVKTPLILHTLQKDNPSKWIKDWCLYYHREHGVNRIIIYDNASDDDGALNKCLESIDDNIEFVLVHWPYEYYKVFNRCQEVKLNHCLALFADSSSYYLNFDIDEYLVNTTALPLKDYLKQANKIPEVRLRGYHSIPQHKVANYPKKPILNRMPCAGDFEYKLISLNNSKSINIYARVHAKKIGCVLVHESLLGKDILLKRVLGKIKRISTRTFFLLLPETILKKLFSQPISSNIQQPVYYNHYMGLNLSEQNIERHPQQSLAQLSKNGYTIDTVMPAKLRKHGLMPK